MGILKLFGALLLTCPLATHAGLKTCESYILAPPGLKVATRDLVAESTTFEKREERRKQLKVYIERAGVGSEELLKYLWALHSDSPDGQETAVTDWTEFLFNLYLIRPGNEVLALKNFDHFLENYWINFLFGTGLERHRKSRMEQGFTWMEQQTQFLERVAKSHSVETARAWINSFNTFLPEIANLRRVLIDFEESAKYLRDYSRQSDAEIEEDDQLVANGENVDGLLDSRKRVEYTREIIAEIEHPLPTTDIQSLLSFHRTDQKLLASNLIFDDEENRWRGTEVEFISPAAAVVFVVRLSRRLGLKNPEISRLEKAISELKALLEAYPRKPADKFLR